MKVYSGMDPRMPLAEVPAHARRVESLGYDGLHVPETIHDSLAVALLALEHTQRIVVRTSVTLAFVRSPTLVAYSAWDLSKLSGGRFQLGLGSQIRQNVEERYGMPWAEPVGRMREYVAAVRALFAAFRSGALPEHAGEHYDITRMQPYFNPGPDAVTAVPPIFLGGVNARMCRLAGEIAAGLVTHPTNSDPGHLRGVVVPAIHDGLTAVCRERSDFELVVGTPVITGRDDAAVDVARERQRRLFAFLYSTPAYGPALTRHGWSDLGDRLRALVRDERWDDLGAVLPDEALETIIATGTHEQLPGLLLDRVGDLADGVLLSPPADPSDDRSFTGVIGRLSA